MTAGSFGLLLSRRDYVVRRQVEPPWRFSILQRLHLGDSIGSAVEFALSSHPIEDAGAASSLVYSAFETWARGGLFQRLIPRV
jgi:hypothetical protein